MQTHTLTRRGNFLFIQRARARCFQVRPRARSTCIRGRGSVFISGPGSPRRCLEVLIYNRTVERAEGLAKAACRATDALPFFRPVSHGDLCLGLFSLTMFRGILNPSQADSTCRPDLFEFLACGFCKAVQFHNTG